MSELWGYDIMWILNMIWDSDVDLIMMMDDICEGID